MLPTFYQTHLQKQLTHAQLRLLTILLDLIQSEKQVRLERLARVFPYPITTESRRRKLQRFLDIPQLTIALQKVSINQLLVNHVLLGGANFINCDRSYVNGGVLICLREAKLSRRESPYFGNEELSHYTGVSYPN